MTIDRVRRIEKEHIKTYGNEGTHACQGINLRRRAINTRPSRAGNEIQKKHETDPYCPPVWATPLDDAPFVIESDEELPAGTGKRQGGEIICNAQRGRNPLRRTARAHMKMPFTTCQSFTTATTKDEFNGQSV